MANRYFAYPGFTAPFRILSLHNFNSKFETNSSCRLELVMVNLWEKLFGLKEIWLQFKYMKKHVSFLKSKKRCI